MLRSYSYQPEVEEIFHCMGEESVLSQSSGGFSSLCGGVGSPPNSEGDSSLFEGGG